MNIRTTDMNIIDYRSSLLYEQWHFNYFAVQANVPCIAGCYSLIHYRIYYMSVLQDCKCKRRMPGIVSISICISVVFSPCWYISSFVHLSLTWPCAFFIRRPTRKLTRPIRIIRKVLCHKIMKIFQHQSIFVSNLTIWHCTCTTLLLNWNTLYDTAMEASERIPYWSFKWTSEFVKFKNGFHSPPCIETHQSMYQSCHY